MYLILLQMTRFEWEEDWHGGYVIKTFSKLSSVSRSSTDYLHLLFPLKYKRSVLFVTFLQPAGACLIFSRFSSWSGINTRAIMLSIKFLIDWLFDILRLKLTIITKRKYTTMFRLSAHLQLASLINSSESFIWEERVV